MFNVESDNHGFSNRATWLVALWYLDMLENLQIKSFVETEGEQVRFESPEDIAILIEDELDDWAEFTTVGAAPLEKVEMYYLLHEVNYSEILSHLSTIEEIEREKKQ